jgi:hypothetical protein
VNKRDGNRLRADNNEVCKKRAEGFYSSLAPGSARIVEYRTLRGADIGVVVNEGDTVSVWNAFTQKIEKYLLADFNARLMGV